MRKEPWEKGEEEPVERVYRPEFPQFHHLASRTGHGGGDFFVVHEFIRAIRTGEPPYLDVYTGLQMSCVGILAHRSALNNHAPYEVPSFHDPEELKRWENDHLSPDPADPPEARIPASTLGGIEVARCAPLSSARELRRLLRVRGERRRRAPWPLCAERAPGTACI